MTKKADVAVKRVYEEPSAGDGYRVLIDRLWPRGLSKEKAGFDEWIKDLAPSTELRHWFGHDPAKWEEFQRRYRTELDGMDGQSASMTALRDRAAAGRLTLLYSASDTEHNNAVALRQYLLGH